MKTNQSTGGILQHGWIILLIVLFALVYSQSLAFVYIDGDDASSIAYHLLGRNPTMQPAYSPYHGMMDALLSVLPAQEGLLRVVSLTLTSLGAVTFAILMLLLIFDMAKIISARARWLTAFLLLLAVPEMFYLGLVYSPTLLAISLMLGAHLLLRKQDGRADRLNFSQARNLPVIFTSLLLFALGVSLRWNTLAYGLVIVADLFTLRQVAENTPVRTRFAIAWGGLALLLGIALAIISNLGSGVLSGSLGTFLMVLNQVGTAGSESYLTMILILTPLFTPGFTLLAGLGFIILVKRKNPLWWVVLAGMIGILPFIRTGTPKFLISAVPGLALCFAVGLRLVWDGITTRWRTIARMGVVIGLVLPWMVGVRVTRPGTAWGPGFEMQPYDRVESEGSQFTLTLGSGTAFPTPESPRPIYGYFSNLLGGIRRNFVVGLSDERQKASAVALQNDLPIVMTAWSPDFFTDYLYALGYTTDDPLSNPFPGSSFTERRFTNPQGQSVRLLYAEVFADNPQEPRQRLSELGADFPQAVLAGYPSTMRALYLDCPAALQKLGNTTAMVDLQKLSAGECEIKSN